MPSASEDEIRVRLEGVRERIRAAAERAGRDPDGIQIVAVTKSLPSEAVRAGYAVGLRIIGENRVEEAEPKQTALFDLPGLDWHMVGHVQSRKARRASEAFSMVHSVDRIKIAELLNREAGSGGRILPVLLECNVSGESSKWGWPLADRFAWPQAAAEFAEIAKLRNLNVLGLMTMAPRVQHPESTRPVFRKLRELREFLRSETSRDWPELSMGMSDDYEMAVEEGATMLRLGRVIFGPRQQA